MIPKALAASAMVCLLLLPFAAPAQSLHPEGLGIPAGKAYFAAGGFAGQAPAPVAGGSSASSPFSRLALGGGVSPLGIRLEATTYVNRYLNARGTGNFFNYTANNISTNGFNISAKAALASAGASVDLYPFPNHGLRFSPGVLFYNTNELSGTLIAKPGTSFTLNGNNYTSSNANPVTGTASVGLHTQNPAFTVTTGWGNQISRRGGHFSIPVELGIALIGSPAVNLALISGQVCDSHNNCQNVATDPTVQSDLQSQIAKYKKDLDPLKTFPILSVGFAYNFRIR